ncbi:gamma-glutamylcyclotransferase family protein [Natrarchaeobius oligotrophus]|uniref:Gamma-glutamylcyclotransferase n=1 Tax=Natrarchaeobius chitinivorans TaxID=1679083 RepID=A0A3N6MG91_NATCH|nr:gamma-glutamylcyclotransferase family protein [Natrarchaeobius chitinivorans]RQH01998.1 gamma-glutamylcyclotransferase [Natrarchaeobius chitinivorans]
MQVFVYGTLTDRARVERVLEIGRFAFDGEATLEGLHRIEGRYPTLAPGGSAEGRLLCVECAALERLDRYEGVESGLYVRVSVPRANDGRPVQVYVGRPERLGVGDRVDWPGEGAFRDRVRTVLERTGAVVRPHE